MNIKERRIAELVTQTVEDLGCELWGVELHASGKHSKLAIYIDNADEGVTVDDCARVSRAVADLLDVEEVMTSAYALEVSSPGMDRILFTLDHYRRCVGEDVEVRMNVPIDGRKRVNGQLVGVEEEQAVVRAGDDEFVLPIEAIARTRVVPRFDLNKKP